MTIDLESGYGDTPEVVGGTIALAIETEPFDQADRIRRARQTVDAANIRFFIKGSNRYPFSATART